MLLAGCGPDGDDPAVWGRVEHVDPEGRYAVQYVAPPWEVLSDEANLRLRIAPELFGYDVDVAASTHGFDLGPVREIDLVADLQRVETFVPADELVDPLADLEPLLEPPPPPEPLRGVDLGDPFAVALAELTHLSVHEHAKIDVDLDFLQTPLGQQGAQYSVVTRFDTFLRVWYLPGQHGVVRAAVVSVFDVATDDVDLMLASVQTDVGGGG